MFFSVAFGSVFQEKQIYYVHFRLPKCDDSKSKWLESISKHQVCDSSVSFMVCDRHFAPSDFVTKRGKQSLREGAIPSIFDNRPTTNTNQRDHDKVNYHHNRNQFDRKRYCKIKHCEHETGTNDRAILFGR